MLPSRGTNSERSSKVGRIERSFLNVSDVQDLSSLAGVAFPNESLLFSKLMDWPALDW